MALIEFQKLQASYYSKSKSLGLCIRTTATQWPNTLIGLAYQGKDIVFRFIIEYNSLRALAPK
jgi:hypothetical protein